MEITGRRRRRVRPYVTLEKEEFFELLFFRKQIDIMEILEEHDLVDEFKKYSDEKADEKVKQTEGK